jgi:hypothetical protein
MNNHLKRREAAIKQYQTANAAKRQSNNIKPQTPRSGNQTTSNLKRRLKASTEPDFQRICQVE